MPIKHMTSKSSKDNGFTLVEMAIVFMLSGMMFSILLYAYKYYMTSGMQERTIEAIERSQSALLVAQIQSPGNHYPCPADPNLGPGNANYGQPVPDCSTGLVRLIGRDTDNADGDNNELTGGEAVLFGAFPFRYFIDPNNDGVENDAIVDTYVARDGFDAWNSKLSYAVTERLTNIDIDPNIDTDGQGADHIFDQNAGAIDIIDETRAIDGTSTLIQRRNATLLNEFGTAHFAIISHGPNRVGAYNREGAQVQNCQNGFIDPNAPPPPEASLPDETDNCRNVNGGNAIFLSGVYSESQINPNDDTIRFMVNKSTSIWEYQGAIYNDNGTTNTDDDVFIYQISNTNSGNVGIGTDTPQQRLDVNGDIQGYEVHAIELCDSAGGDCMLPDAIGGELVNMRCDPGFVIDKISNNSARCVNPFTNTPFGMCANGTFLVGISNVSGPICR